MIFTGRKSWIAAALLGVLAVAAFIAFLTVTGEKEQTCGEWLSQALSGEITDKHDKADIGMACMMSDETNGHDKYTLPELREIGERYNDETGFMPW